MSVLGTQSIPSITLTIIMFWLIHGLNPIKCCSELFINHLGTTTNDLSIVEGDPMEVNCTLFTSSLDLADGQRVPINSRMLFFKYNGSRISSDKLEIVDDLTIRYKVDQTSTTENGYYMCYLDIGVVNVKPKTVCATYITIARPPSSSDNFNLKCSGYDLKNFTCSWDIQDYNIATSYDLSIILAGDLVYSTCPKRNGKNSCTFSTSDKSPYLISNKKLNFRLDVSNKFGSIQRIFDIDHYSNVILAPVESLYPIDIGPDFVSLNWDPPRSIAHDSYLNKLTEYQLKIYPVKRYETSSHDILYDDVVQANYGKSILVQEVRQYNATKLIPFVRYSIEVRCRLVTEDGEGKWSKETLGNVETKPDLPYLYPALHPGEIELIQKNDNRLDAVIYFSKVDEMHTNGPDFSYLLKIRPIQMNIQATLTNDTALPSTLLRPLTQSIPNDLTLSALKVASEKPSSTSDLISFQSKPCILSLGTITQESVIVIQRLTDLESDSCTIENLNKSFDYQIEMMSHNSIGTSVGSSSIVVPVKVYNQIHPGVDQFYAIAWNGNNFTLYWTVSSIDMIKHYTIVWCEIVDNVPQCDSNMNHVDVPQKQTSVELTINFDRVQFGISVIDRTYGLSSGIKWATCIESGSLSSVKNRFKRFNIISDGSNSIRVAWKLDCPALDHFIDHYEILYCRTDYPCDKTLTTIDIANLSTEYTIDNLDSSTGYNVTIRAVTFKGAELESSTITIETKVNVISFTLIIIIIVAGIVSLFLIIYTLAMCTLRRRKVEKKLKESVDSNWIPKMPPGLKGDANILLNPVPQEIRNEYENKEYMNSDTNTHMNKLNSLLGSFDQQLTKDGNVIILSTISGNNRLYDIIPCSLSSASSSSTEEPDEGLELTSSLPNQANNLDGNNLIRSFSSVSSTLTKKQRSRRLSDGGGCDSEDSGYSTKLSDKNVYYKSDAFTIDGLIKSIDENSSYIVIPEAQSEVTPVEILMNPSNDYVVNNNYVSLNQSLSDYDLSCNDQTGITINDDYQTSPNDYVPSGSLNEPENVNMTSNGYVYA